jgi:hypothetical protein
LEIQLDDGGAVNALSSPTTLSIDVAINVAPVISLTPVSTDEDTVLSGQVGVTDPEGDAITYTLDQGTSNGTLVFNTDGSYSYTPTPIIMVRTVFRFLLMMAMEELIPERSPLRSIQLTMLRFLLMTADILQSLQH